ncbi:MAG TPA: hypothetical protein VFW25_12475 [Silvibacterium sp.]|nr:hypothetical protein [Silvibacterium sp.]
MEFPRREQQAQADLSISGQLLLQPSSKNPVLTFCCRVCGGHEFTLETRRGNAIQLAWMKAWQMVTVGDFAGTHNVYSCAHCVQRLAQAHESVRIVLMGKLMFAARDLAENQFRRPVGKGYTIQCAECRLQQRERELNHAAWCRTGHVLKLLEALMQLGEKDSGSDSRRAGTPAADGGTLRMGSATRGGAR